MSDNCLFTELDDSFLPQMAELFRRAFAGEPWNDAWSNDSQLAEYIYEISNSFNSLNFGLVRNGSLEVKRRGLSGIFLQTATSRLMVST